MSRPDGRIEKGQRLATAISARAWNRAQDAADIVLGATPGAVAGDSRATTRPYNWVYCQNMTGTNVPRWGVMRIDGVIITPTQTSSGATASFEQMPVVRGSMPSNSNASWCVAVEPILSTKIGKVAVSGVVPVRVQVPPGSYASTAGPVDGQIGYLVAGASGAEVLWAGSASGTNNWGLIRLGPPAVAFGTFEGAWAIGSTKDVTIKDTTHKVTASNILHNIGVDCGTRNCAIAKDGTAWYLIAAQCD